MKFYTDLFSEIISPENLFSSWSAFKAGKGNKWDVMLFERNLESNIFELHRDLRNKVYHHGPYESFYIRDPKQRNIHKAFVRDRILHHAIFAVLNPIFEETFIPTSFSCRVGYGTHRGIGSLERMIRKVSRNGLGDCFVLKCDIRKFFDSVDHDILLSILKKRIKDERTTWLLREIVESYATNSRERERERGRAAKRYPYRKSHVATFCERLYERI